MEHPVIIFIHKGFHDIEVMYAKYRLEEAGYRVILAGPITGENYIGKYGYAATAEMGIHEVQERLCSAVICTGGWAPLALRTDGKVRKVIGEFLRAGKIVGAICHGEWLAISAGLCGGMKVASPLSLRDDLVNAGAMVQDEPVVVDLNLVTARNTSDLPQFMKAVLDTMTQYRERRPATATATA